MASKGGQCVGLSRALMAGFHASAMVLRQPLRARAHSGGRGTPPCLSPCSDRAFCVARVGWRAPCASRGAALAAAQGAANETFPAVVIVESPAKAKKIQKFLGDQYLVIASVGHVRNLPRKSGSVDPERDFAMRWSVQPKAQDIIEGIERVVSSTSELILATDPDREGEAIAWHIAQVLEEHDALAGVNVKRVTFSEVTEGAVLHAMANPRGIDKALVDAYLARVALDYLVGFTLSPVLWQKLPIARSAGRVQSAALRLVVEREREVQRFVPQEFWSVSGVVESERGARAAAQVVTVDGRKANGPGGLHSAAEADGVVERLSDAQLHVARLSTRHVSKNPSPPYVTSTLQQDAYRRLGFASARTMQVAQALYEGRDHPGGGLITYMRTDGTHISPEALEAIRAVIGERYGAAHLPDEPRSYRSKQKNAQEAHEAIRPTDMRRAPDDLARMGLPQDQVALYGIIWRRTVACQMVPSKSKQLGADVATESGDVVLRASASVEVFDGYLRAWRDGGPAAPPPGLSLSSSSIDDTQSGPPSAAGAEALLALREGEPMRLSECGKTQHFTKPPARLNEASLVSLLEELGIGRPSTFAAMCELIQQRGYADKVPGGALVPSDAGRLLTQFLVEYFPDVVNYEFTASMEEKLDEVSAGHVAWRDLLGSFWGPFSARVDEVMQIDRIAAVQAIDKALEDLLGYPVKGGSGSAAAGNGAEASRGGKMPIPGPEGVERTCPSCGTAELKLCVSAKGAWIGCSGYPDCTYALSTFTPGYAGSTVRPLSYPREVGAHSEDGKPIMMKKGPYGPYLEWGELRASINVRRSNPATLSKEQCEEILRIKLEKKAQSEAESDSSSGEVGAPKKRKAAKRPRAKRTPSAYILFCNDARPALLEEHPDWPPTEVIKELAVRWRGIDDEVRAKYEARAQELKEAAAAERGDDGRGKAKAKRAPTAWVLFCNDERPVVRSEQPGLAMGAVTQELARRWRELDDAERARYVAAAEDKKQEMRETAPVA
ncbi:unnamed protein product [Pedinophyceae sp. YPF-701]|nr:unnamed protein product [Pedinophyceae sp. YPF-701]